MTCFLDIHVTICLITAKLTTVKSGKVSRRWQAMKSIFSTEINEILKIIKASINSLWPQWEGRSLLRHWMCYSEGLAMHSETLSFLRPPPLAPLCLSELKSKIKTENSTACCLATYTRKPHYIRSHEGHVQAHAHPHNNKGFIHLWSQIQNDWKIETSHFATYLLFT